MNTTIPSESKTTPFHAVVSREEWTKVRQELLREEKEYTRLRDKLRAKRADLPWVLVEKDYVFEGGQGPVSFAELFRGRSQLIVQHFMFGPGWEEGCKGCSFLADHVDAARQHFEHHDVAFVAISRATYPELAKFQKRMGWQFPWVSSNGNSFNYDYAVSFTPEQMASGRITYNFEEGDAEIEELPGQSAFYKDEDGRIYHTYSSYARGGEELLGTYMFLDIAPKGRNETTIMDWLRHHDRYDEEPGDSCCSNKVSAA